MRLNDKIKKTSVLQHDTSDCGVACLVSAIRYFGGHSSVENIRRLSGTTRYGTSMLGLLQAARQSGLDATGYEAGVSDIIGYDGTLILHVKPEAGLEHYVVCFGHEKGKFIIWDPAKGLNTITANELELLWESKKCLGVKPNGSFRYMKQERMKGISWLKEILRPDTSLLSASLVLGILIALLGLVMAVFSQKLIDVILPSKNLNLLLVAVGLVFILLIARIMLSAVRQQILIYQGKEFNIRVIDNFFGSLMFLPSSFFDTRKTGDFVGRLNDTIRIQRVITEFVSIYLIDVLILIISVTALFFYCEVSALFTIIVIPVLFLVVYSRNKRIISTQHDMMAGYARSESNYIDSIQGISAIKSLGWHESIIGRNKSIYANFQEKVFSLGKIKISLGILTGIIGTLYLVMVLIYISVQVFKSMMSEGELLAVLSISSSLVPSILNLALVAIPVSEARVAVERMFEFSRIEPEESEVPDEMTVSTTGEIRLENISFRYPGRPLLLRNIGLTIEKGKVVSLVGESGCGKSTLANILLRFYDAESGRIMVNGDTDSGSISLRQWRALTGIVPQEIHIFNGTILQNLIAGYGEEEIRCLAGMITALGLDKFIDSFPSGIMTLIGEEGINLSGGQKQLIAFIRALIRKPEILVIDEGTSGMDRGTESMITDLLQRLKKETGVLLISHRINMIRDISDRIYVMEDKSIVAEGSHDELMQFDNLYKRFWDDFH